MAQQITGYQLQLGDKKSDWVFVNDPSDDICIGLEDASGKYQQFDSYEAWHLGGWAKDKGFTVNKTKFEFDPENMTMVECETIRGA